MTNGIGPAWFPASVRRWLTRFGSSFFKEATWVKHDEGYAYGSPSRAVCDLKFLQAMLRDASQATTAPRIFISCFLAWLFWSAVRLFGWMSYKSKSSKEK